MRLTIIKTDSPVSHLLQILGPTDNQFQLLTVSISQYLHISKTCAHQL